MSITTVVTPLVVLPLSGIEPLDNQRPQTRGAIIEGSSPSAGYEAWSMTGTDTGDGGGGVVVFQFRIPQDQRFYTLTSVYMGSFNTAIETGGHIKVPPLDFEAYPREDLTGDVIQLLPVVDDGVQTIARSDLFVPIYVGRALTADSEVALRWTTNTNADVYDMRVAGVRSLRPGIPWFNVLQQARAL